MLNPIIRAQTPSGLPITNINAINTFGTVLQQTIRKTTRGDPAIQTDAFVHSHREGF